MSNDYKTDRPWADTFESQVLSILKSLLPYVVVLAVASDEADKQWATDFEVQLSGGTIAVRLRRLDKCPWEDLTIRSRRENGKKTELAKIKEGHASRYFYGWIDNQGIISKWMLVDLDQVRSTGILEKPRQEKENKDENGKLDGTFFIYIPYKELLKERCILACRGFNGIKTIRVKKSQNPPSTVQFTVPPVPLPLWSEVSA